MAEGDVSVTLAPTAYCLPDTNGTDLYGPFETIAEANAVRPKLGNRVAADAKALGVLRTTVQGRRGRKAKDKPSDNGQPANPSQAAGQPTVAEVPVRKPAQATKA